MSKVDLLNLANYLDKQLEKYGISFEVKSLVFDFKSKKVFIFSSEGTPFGSPSFFIEDRVNIISNLGEFAYLSCSSMLVSKPIGSGENIKHVQLSFNDFDQLSRHVINLGKTYEGCSSVSLSASGVSIGVD